MFEDRIKKAVVKDACKDCDNAGDAGEQQACRDSNNCKFIKDTPKPIVSLSDLKIAKV